VADKPSEQAEGIGVACRPGGVRREASREGADAVGDVGGWTWTAALK
jgi:hypothetical protein